MHFAIEDAAVLTSVEIVLLVLAVGLSLLVAWARVGRQDGGVDRRLVLLLEVLGISLVVTAWVVGGSMLPDQLEVPVKGMAGLLMLGGAILLVRRDRGPR
jgi:hypothetical protein